ncbi:MAG: acylphosphatase [Planctomycetota bacterium]|nr:acylphosphatase [Planctomycetota bacterium]
MADETANSQRITVYFSGTVQGVGFRFTARRVAGRFAVTGFVRNMSDGRVEVVAEGSIREIRAFIEAIRAEMGHYISNAEENRSPADGRFKNFDVRF